MDRISIITVTRNDFGGLLKTRESVRSQSVEPFEYIVLDGGSDVSVLKASMESALNFETFISGGGDEGVYDGMNKAVREASGDWILFLNSGDCFAEDDTLAKLTGFDAQSASAVYGNNRVLISTGLVWARAARALGSFKRGMPFCHQSVLVRRNLITSSPFSVGRINSDYEFFYRLHLEGHSFRCINIEVSEILAGGVSDSRRIRKYLEDMEVIRKISSLDFSDYFYYGKTISSECIKIVVKAVLPVKVRSRILRFLRT